MGKYGLIGVFLAFLLLSLNGVHAIITLEDTSIEEYMPTAYMGGITFHVGEICASCHTRFSKNQPYSDELPVNVSNNEVLHIFPCSKPACHQTPPTKFVPKGTSRWSLHMGICENCHPRWNTSFNTIHNTHLDFGYLLINRSGVECDICHARPQGFTSSVAKIPPWSENESSFNGSIIKPDWKGNCAFCHFTINGAQRVHDVHEPVLLNACPICHSKHILNSPSLFNRIDYPYPFEVEKESTFEEKIIDTVITNESILKPPKTRPPMPRETLPILSEFYLYFDEILVSLLGIYDLVV